MDLKLIKTQGKDGALGYCSGSNWRKQQPHVGLENKQKMVELLKLRCSVKGLWAGAGS